MKTLNSLPLVCVPGIRAATANSRIRNCELRNSVAELQEPSSAGKWRANSLDCRAGNGSLNVRHIGLGESTRVPPEFMRSLRGLRGVSGASYGRASPDRRSGAKGDKVCVPGIPSQVEGTSG